MVVHPDLQITQRTRGLATRLFEPVRAAGACFCRARSSCARALGPAAPPRLSRRMGNTLPLVSSSEFPFFKFKLTPSVDEVEAEEAREIEAARQAREAREQAQASGSAAGSDDTTSG